MSKYTSVVLHLLTALLFGGANASAARTLLDVTDRLYIVDENTGSYIDQVELRQFPYVMSYSKNVTIEGDICYSLDLQSFIKDCYHKQSTDTTWVSFDDTNLLRGNSYLILVLLFLDRCIPLRLHQHE